MHFFGEALQIVENAYMAIYIAIYVCSMERLQAGGRPPQEASCPGYRNPYGAIGETVCLPARNG